MFYWHCSSFMQLCLLGCLAKYKHSCLTSLRFSDLLERSEDCSSCSKRSPFIQGRIFFRDGKACILFERNGLSNVHTHPANVFRNTYIYIYMYLYIDIDINITHTHAFGALLYPRLSETWISMAKHDGLLHKNGQDHCQPYPQGRAGANGAPDRMSIIHRAWGSSAVYNL